MTIVTYWTSFLSALILTLRFVVWPGLTRLGAWRERVMRGYR